MEENRTLDVVRQFRLFYEVVKECESNASQITVDVVNTRKPTNHDENQPNIGETQLPNTSSEEAPSSNGAPNGGNIAEVSKIVGRLVTALEDRGRDFSLYGGEYGARLFQRVIYIFAAFADEMMLSRHWNGREIWLASPLEVRLFGSQSAGEEIFSDIESDLADYELGKRDMAKVYLMALNLGFKGRYKGSENEGAIGKYKSSLFALINDRDPSHEQAGKLFLGNIYQYNQTGGSPQFMPYLRPWLLSIVAVVIVYVIASHLVWATSVSDLEEVVQSLITQLSR